MTEVLDFLMDVKDGQLAEALSRELKFFVNIAKKTKAPFGCLKSVGGKRLPRFRNLWPLASCGV